VISQADGDGEEPEHGGEPSYAYKPSLLGAPWVFTLKPAGLAWEFGRHHGLVRYERIRRIRLSFRPVTLQSNRFLTEIWSTDNPKLKIASSSWRGMMQQDNLGEAYTRFVTEFHRRLAASGTTPRLSAGMPMVPFGVGLVICAAAVVALTILIARAVQSGEWGASAMILGLFALFAWQIGDYLRRNRPGDYRLEALPRQVLPRP